MLTIFYLIDSELLVHEDLEDSADYYFIQAFTLLAVAGYFIVFKHIQLAGLYQQGVLRGEFYNIGIKQET